MARLNCLQALTRSIVESHNLDIGDLRDVIDSLGRLNLLFETAIDGENTTQATAAIDAWVDAVVARCNMYQVCPDFMPGM